MTSVKHHSFYLLVSFFAVLAVAAPVASRAAANDSLSLTITPPFFELNVSPNDSWASSIKVVNTNAADLTVYASVMGFTPSDDQGHGKFLSASSTTNDRDALANWITAPKSAVIIPAGGAGEIPFSVVVPSDASPGGHYAAILIGTEPPASGGTGSRVGVSSYISSLIFVRVAGDIKEEGSIEEFSTAQDLYEDPNVAFTLRFKNSGNVHLRPVGEVEIYNAWGKERGKIDVNQAGDLGYVLPSSTREFDFEWRGDPSWFDIGPYTAVATLAYGENGSKNVSSTISFWILPIWKLLMVAGGTLFFIIIFVVAIRRYVRRALTLEISKYGGTPPQLREVPSPNLHHESMKPKLSLRTLSEPVREGVVDLRKAYEGAVIKDGGEREGFDWGRYLRSLRKYAVAGILFLLVLLGVLWISLYIKDLLGNSRPFQVKVDIPGQSTSWTPGISGK